MALNKNKVLCMNKDLRSLGIIFKDKREEMHLSLKEVENATSIRMMYLQAIEEGKVENYLSAVYALGFIKQYASFLGLDAEKIIKENAKAFKLATNTPDFDYGIGTLEIRNKNKSGTKKGSNLIWLSVSVGVLVIAWFFAKTIGVI
jgi:cytoskeletal protein RodZ